VTRRRGLGSRRIHQHRRRRHQRQNAIRSDGFAYNVVRSLNGDAGETAEQAGQLFDLGDIQRTKALSAVARFISLINGCGEMEKA
jgi:hypothetical protein